MVIMDKLPMTVEGELDRERLPAPEWQSRSEYVGPRNRTEELLCSVFCGALSIERIGIEENFFELGGHSLLATRIAARLRDILEVDVPLRTLFEAPTVRELAEIIHWGGQRTTTLRAGNLTNQEEVEGTI
jgi:acyl carrier protein